MENSVVRPNIGIGDDRNAQTVDARSFRLADTHWAVQIMLLWLVILIVLSAIGFFAVRMVDLREGYDPVIGVRPDTIPGLWARWDSPYYIDLADQGYRNLPYAMGYFPLYPLAISALSNVTGMNLALAGMVIAQLSYLGALLVFYQLARRIRDEHAYAMCAVLYLALFPSAFFGFAVYAEPLSLLFSVLAVWLALSKPPSLIPAGGALAIASAARPVGWLLNIVLVGEVVRNRDFRLSTLFRLCIALALSVSGVVLFVFYLYSITGTFLAIPEAQSAWLRQWQWPWTTYTKSVELLIQGSAVGDDWFLYVINAVDLFFTTLAIMLTLVAIHWSRQGRFVWSLTVYLVVTLLFLLAQQGLNVVPLWGMTRWVAALFPLFLVLGDVTQRRSVNVLLLSGSAVLLCFFTAWWMTGRWVG